MKTPSNSHLSAPTCQGENSSSPDKGRLGGVGFYSVLITNDLAGVVWQPSQMASSSISPRALVLYLTWSVPV